ncbi:MAG TPA: hypothetical protein VE398_24820 [Acidobacteriota bacterium]|nr:hypothetical protein [Acidobacteriota bacterium]
MTTKKNGLVQNLLIWSYDRGTLQYDIICALILAFIFFVPPSCFAPKKKPGISQVPSGQTAVKDTGALPAAGSRKN